jgi:hypothetical protein
LNFIFFATLLMPGAGSFLCSPVVLKNLMHRSGLALAGA